MQSVVVVERVHLQMAHVNPSSQEHITPSSKDDTCNVELKATPMSHTYLGGHGLEGNGVQAPQGARPREDLQEPKGRQHQSFILDCRVLVYSCPTCRYPTSPFPTGNGGRGVTGCRPCRPGWSRCSGRTRPELCTRHRSLQSPGETGGQ